jgi:hypothetical protein
VIRQSTPAQPLLSYALLPLGGDEAEARGPATEADEVIVNQLPGNAVYLSANFG